MGRLALILIASTLLGCSPKALYFSLSSLTPSQIVTGTLKPLSSLSCTSPKAKIYALDASGGKITPALAEGDIHADGSYKISVRSEGFNVTGYQAARYIVEAEGCNETISRVVTGLQEQSLDYRSSLLAYSVGTSLGPALISTPRDSLESFLGSLSSSSSLSASYSEIIANPTKASQFAALFGVGPNALEDLPPKYSQSHIPANLNENQSHSMSLNTYHWNPTYSTVVLWKVDNDVIGTGHNIVWSPDADAQGNHTLTVYWGQDDGGGNLDLGQPFDSRAFTVQISNTIPPTSPSIFAPAFTTTHSINVDIDTGNGFANCESFSSMALTENSALPPSSGDFILECTDPVTQTLPHTLSSGDGLKTLRLWVKDSAGNISATSSSVDVIVDSTSPSVTLSALTGGEVLSGGASVDIQWSATDGHMASNPISLYYSTDSGVNWTLIADSLANSGSYSWTTPSLNSATVRVRVEAVDQIGNLGSDSSDADFTIDSTAPSAPLMTVASSNLSNSLTASLSLTCNADYAGILLSESSSQPSPDDVDWSPCAASMNFNVSAGDGVKTIYAWSKDLAGNVSATSNSDSFTLDQTSPVIALTSHNSGAFQGGMLTTLTWSATDTHWGSGTVDIQTSTDNGNTWSDLAIGTTNDGSHGFVLPSVDNNQYRIKVKGCDEAGNCSEATSINALTIDVTAPVISSFEINDGAVYAGTTLTAVKATITDNFTPSADIQVRTGNAHAVTGDCQSEYNDSGWISYTNATTSISHQVTPTDGVKKVCIWAKDEVGNVMVYSPTVGTDGVDTDTIKFEIGNPPVITSFDVTRNLGGTTANIGDAMTITWDVSDVEGLNNNPVSFSYTTDNAIWKDIYTDGDISNASNVTWIGSLSGNPTSANGTVATWTAPSSGYFRVKVVGLDQAGNSSIPILSQMFNAGNWSVYAGSKDRGVGGSGLSAALYTEEKGSPVAIHPLTGDIYALDEGFGIKKLDIKTGLVSTVIGIGGTNLPDDGPLPASPRVNSNKVFPKFDSKGRLYLTIGDRNAKIYQIDFANDHVRLYAGGGSDNDGGVPSTSLLTSSTYTFDESDNMYVLTMCAPPSSPYQQPKRMVKIAQNPDGSPGAVTRIIGDCSFADPNYGGSAYSSPVGAFLHSHIADILAFDNGNTIYFWTTTLQWKIINGTVYSTSFGGGGCGTLGMAYNSSNNKIYAVNSACGIDEVTLGGAQNGGEISTPLFNGNVITPGCTNDGISATSACTKTSWVKSLSGIIYFVDGIGITTPSSYRVRYLDGNSKVQTIFGSLPFLGDGMDKSVIRSSMAGIYYKKATEPNQSVFPEGLYFMDYGGGVFARIDPTTGITEVLWGNQARQIGGYNNGDTISKDISMGEPYQGGSLMPLNFDSTGLPWMRVSNTLVKINASRQIEFKTNNSGYWHNLADGADPSTVSLYAGGTRSGLTLKDQALILLSAGYLNPSGGLDPNMSIRILDFGALTTTKILGGNYVYSDLQDPSPDLLGGVASAPLWHRCYIKCFTHYDASSDRLYFSEKDKVRYITTPSNTATSTLVTLLQRSSDIYNLTVNLDGSQVWYTTGGTTLYCKDISSGKSWCDNTTNHFQAAANAGLYFDPELPNIFTWKDNDTLFLSTYGGEILQFNLPTGP